MSLARVFFCAMLALWSLTVTTHAQTQAQPEWLNSLRAGGYVIVIRHGATYMDQADTDPLNLSNVAKQRQLNDAGRAKAKEMGEAFRRLQIPVGPVVIQHVLPRDRDRKNTRLRRRRCRPLDVSRGWAGGHADREQPAHRRDAQACRDGAARRYQCRGGDS